MNPGHEENFSNQFNGLRYFTKASSDEERSALGLMLP